MAEEKTERSETWPKIFFVGTLISVLAIGLFSYFYFEALAKLQAQSHAMAEVKAHYEQRVSDLKGRLTIEQNQTVKIPTTIVTQDCASSFFGAKICIPKTEVVQREVPQVVKVEDPNVRKELDDTLATLQKLSAQSVSTTVSIDQLTPYYDFAQKMMKPIVSLIILIVSLYIIVSKAYNSDQEKWAFGSLGTIIGFWLK
jgi:hypothetical protein